MRRAGLRRGRRLRDWAGEAGASRRRRAGLLPGLPDAPIGADLVSAARPGDPTAARLIEEAGIAVGRGIAAAAALLDLDRVVIGGSVALGAGELLLGPLRRELARDARLDFTRGIEQSVMLSDLGLRRHWPAPPPSCAHCPLPDAQGTASDVHGAVKNSARLVDEASAAWPRWSRPQASSMVRSSP